MRDQLLAVVIGELPEVIAWVRLLFRRRHPDEPIPTDAEVIAAYESAFVSSRARDEQWLAAHPDPTPTTPA